MTKPNILLDISRTVARARLPVATGIDRVERAYIDWALHGSAIFLAHFDGCQYLLKPNAVQRLVDWLDGAAPDPSRDLKAHFRPNRAKRLTQAQSLVRRAAFAAQKTLPGLATAATEALAPRSVYINVGHDNCTNELMQALGAAGIARVVMVHDTIPLDHPEFARAETPVKFRSLLDAVARTDGVLANSTATARQLSVHMGVAAECWVTPLGINKTVAPFSTNPEPHPSFLCIGTIEPRKNHALLLQLWQRMHETRSTQDIPQLHIVGRRGWLNEDVFSQLDTLPFIGETVFEAVLDDATLANRMVSARAVLFPSLAEGYGLPLAEALAAGTPVIASDLPALREVGGDVPEYISPQDCDGWQAAIDAYAKEPSARREVQISRISGWQIPTWDEHFAIVENALETILVQTDAQR